MLKDMLKHVLKVIIIFIISLIMVLLILPVSDSDYSAISDIGFHSFDESPFEFINEVEIQEINFIKTTKYVYYKIKDLVTEEIYYGILDIGWNRVVFNTKRKHRNRYTLFRYINASYCFANSL